MPKRQRTPSSRASAATVQDVAAVNLLKGLAIIAVIVLHVLSSVPHVFAGAMTSFSVIVTDQFLRFCVPLFIGLSGYALASRYGSKIDLPTFFKRRVLRILPQYILWSLIFIFAMPFLYPAWGDPSFG